MQPVDPSLYPFEPHWLEADGGRLHYVDEGEGPVVLCTHGNPTWSFYYRNLIQGLSDSYRVIAPDHIGCGRSDKPQDWPYTVAAHVANIEKLVLELDLKDITLVCHDWGGPTGFGVAVKHPERFKGFVVMNTAAFFVPALPWRIRVCRIPGFGALAVRGLNGFARAATMMTVEDSARMTPAVKAGYLAPYDSWADRIATLRFVEDIPLAPSHPSWDTIDGIDKGLSQLKDKPMKIFWGEKDWCFTPRFRGEWLERFPDAEVTPFEDAGHYVLEDAHERMVPEIRDFLTRRVHA